MDRPPVLPMPNAGLLKELISLGFGYVRFADPAGGPESGVFELFVGGDVVFKVSYASWRADPAGTDDNLRHAVEKWLQRRLRRP